MRETYVPKDTKICVRCKLPILGMQPLINPEGLLHTTPEHCHAELIVAREAVLLEHTARSHEQRHAALPPHHVFEARRKLQEVMRDAAPKGTYEKLVYRIADACVGRLEEIAVGKWRDVREVQMRAKDVLEGKKL